MKLTSAMLPRQGRRTLIAVVTSLVLSLSVVGAPAASAATGDTWTIRTSAADTDWESVTYGAGLFVAVASFGSGNRVMTSPDGESWTGRNAAANNYWRSVTYGAGLFVAVASGGDDRVMTSPDGEDWTGRTAAAANAWLSVTYGAGLFVAVAASGSGNRVMTSPDGINWTSQSSAADNSWQSVTYGNSTFVAVAASGSGNRVMTSPDGEDWTIRTPAADNSWYSVTYSAGLFVAVASSGTGNRVMTSGTSTPAAPSDGSGSQSVAPQSVNVDIGLDTGEVPASWSGETTIGSWLSLPATSEVSGTGENAGKEFLGVATSEDFPVEIAQTQIDNGWGAYEIYSDDGSLLSVFIPAGYSVHVTASPRVFAIWSTATPPAVGGQVTN